MSSLFYKRSFNLVPINCVWSKYSGCVCCGCEKKLVCGNNRHTFPQNYTQQQQRLIFFFSASCVSVYVCVCVGGVVVGDGGSGSIPHAPQVGVTQSPPYQGSMGNLVPGGRNSALN